MSLTDVKRYSTFPEWTEKVDEFCCICLTPFATTTESVKSFTEQVMKIPLGKF